MTGSGRLIQWASASATRTGGSPSARLHSTWTPYMCGWLATIARTGPSARIRATTSSSRKPIGSHSRLPSGVTRSLDCWPIPAVGELVIAQRSGSSGSRDAR